VSTDPASKIVDLDDKRSTSRATQRVGTIDRFEYDEVIGEITDAYLDEVDPALTGEPAPSPNEIKSELLRRVNARFEAININLKGPDRFTRLKVLTPSQIAHVLMRLHNVVMIPAGLGGDKRYDLLGIYVGSGTDEGLYITSDIKIDEIAMRYNRELTINAGKEVHNILRIHASQKRRCTDQDLVPVNNGIFDYNTKTLLPFTADTVFLSKARVNLNPQAKSPTIHNDEDGTDWDVESWIAELSDDPEIIHLLWQVIGAVVRPHVRWNKTAWFYSEVGSNGKGTLCTLMRNVVGEASSVSIPLSDFGKDFMLEPLQYASSIIVDENDVGVFLDKVANLKAVVTNDIISINRKGLVPISYRFWGFMVQCLNEFPQIRDRSDSFYRRQLFVPFEKNFKGIERKYIKEYLGRTDVLEYVLKRVLIDMDPYYQLDEPEATLKVLDRYKEANDPIREFWNEHEESFKWDLLPFQFLYDLYKGWFAKTNPSGKVIGRNRFIANLLQIVRSSKHWYCKDQSSPVRAGSKISVPEPLILLYDVQSWMRRGYSGKDPRQICSPDVASSYRGLERFGTAATGTDDAETDLDFDHSLESFGEPAGTNVGD